MDQLNSTIDFLKLVIITTFSQLIWLLGLLFVFGLILYILARFTRLTYVKSAGRKLDVIVTGWIGTPVHELGHAVFCILFRHRILEMRLYTPNSTDGTLGYVNHAYNPGSTYQRIGNFFIGVGPIIFGAVVLYAALYYLVPEKDAVFSGIEAQSSMLVAGVRGNFSGIFESLWDTTTTTLSAMFSRANFSDYRFWIFLYLAMCISSHMELSPPDIRGAKSGLISLIIFLLFFNLFIMGMDAMGLSGLFGSLWKYIQIETYTASINRIVGMFGALFVFATIISALNFAASYTLLTIYNLVRGRGLINPVWY